jgi:hypothetical protein
VLGSQSCGADVGALGYGVLDQITEQEFHFLERGGDPMSGAFGARRRR